MPSPTITLQPPEEGNAGYLLWQGDRLPALIDWKDPVVTYGLHHPIKYARLIVRQASSPHARGADASGQRYFVQLVLEGVPSHKPKHPVGQDTVGLDLGPSTIAIVPREGSPRLEVLCAELAPDAQAIRRLQRQMDRQRRANNPANYDSHGRIKKRGKQRLTWKHSKRYLATRRRKATKERKLAAHRKSLHGRLVHEIVARGEHRITEKMSYRAWQKQFGSSVGLRAPGMFIDMLRRTVASTGGTLLEVPTRSTKLSQFCHGCGAVRSETVVAALAPVPLWHWADPARPLLGVSGRLSGPSRSLSLVCPGTCRYWEGREPGLRAAYELTIQRASAGQPLPRSFGIPRVGACLPEKSQPSHTRARLP